MTEDVRTGEVGSGSQQMTESRKLRQSAIFNTQHRIYHSVIYTGKVTRISRSTLKHEIQCRPLIRRPVIRIDRLYESNSLGPNHSYIYTVVQKQTAYKNRPLIKPRLHDATFVKQHRCSWTSMEIGACLNILQHWWTMFDNVELTSTRFDFCWPTCFDKNPP